MFEAAKISLSCVIPQLSQVQTLSFRVSDLLMVPHVQSLLLGSKRPMRIRFLPDHRHLYSSIETKLPHATSLMARDSLLFFSIPEIFRFSTQTVWFSRTMRVETLCKKSFRRLVTFSCCLASLIRDLSLFLLPFFLRLCCLDNLRSFFKAFVKCLGFAIFSPVESVAKSFSPTSMPTAFDLSGVTKAGSTCGVSTNTEAKNLPVAVLETVTVLTVPSKVRLSTALILPILGNWIVEAVKSILQFCGHWKLWWVSFFDLNCGKPFFSRKNRVYAESRFSNTDCMACELISFSHSCSFFKAGNSRCISYRDSDLLSVWYACVFFAKAQFHIQRHDPKCWLSNSVCAWLGYNLYRYALSIYKSSASALAKQCINAKYLSIVFICIVLLFIHVFI